MSRTDDEHLEMIKTLRDEAIDLLRALNELSLKPDYNIDGQAIFWASYRKNLKDEIKAYTDQIAGIEGSYEIMSIGI